MSPGHGPVTGDVAWGGNWFFLVNDHGQELDLRNVERLTDFTWRIRQALRAAGHHRPRRRRDRPHRTVRPAARPAQPQPQLRPLSRQGVRPLAVRHRHQRQARLPVRRRQAQGGRGLAAGEHHRQRLRGERAPRRRPRHPAHHRLGLRHRRGDAAARPGRPVLHGDSCMSGHVVVVGGGVIGAACAYYLSRAGWSVTVLDRGDFGKGCSHGNCGFVCPSHVLPLAVPGAVRCRTEGAVSAATRRSRSSRASTRRCGAGCSASPAAATSAT